jgi:hypothetical protein
MGATCAAPVRADVVSDWWDTHMAVRKAADLTMGARFSPETSGAWSRYALALFEAANATDRRYASYLKLPVAAPGASTEAAVAAAARDAMLHFYPEERRLIEDAYTVAIADVPEGPAREAGITAGKAAAAAAVARKGLDPSLPPIVYRPDGTPGRWVPSALPYDPRELQMTPWVLNSASDLRIGPPVSLTSPEWAAAFNEVKRLGEKESKARSASDTIRARFWARYELEPALRQIAGQPGRSIVQNARTYALVMVAGDDVDLVLADGKMHHRFWRPMNAIRTADDDGNPATAQDLGWQPLLNTPNQPEYPCGHCVYAWTIATILTAEGPLGGGVSFSSEGMPGIRVTVPDFRTYARDVSQSRIHAGVHFRTTNAPSDAAGVRLGELVLDRFAPPLKQAR